MLKLFATSALAVALAGFSSAEDTSRNDELRTSLNQETIRFVAQSLDHTDVQDLSEAVGVTALATDANDGSQLSYAMEGKACQDGPDCLGVEIQVVFAGAFTSDTVNEINQRFAAIKATLGVDGQMYLTRYLILDNGQTVGNIRTNLLNAVAIADFIQDELTAASPPAPVVETAPEIVPEATPVVEAAVTPVPEPQPEPKLLFGDDSGDYANDDSCDDARFIEDGDDWDFQRAHVMRDASDCRRLHEEGSLTVYLDFGENTGEYADNNKCDDIRFKGEGRSVLETDSHVKKDAADCIAAYQAGTISRE